MADENKELTRPVLNALACIGIAGVSTVLTSVSGTGLIGLAGSAIMTILSGITGNIASDQLLKIDNKGLMRWWKRKGPDLSNHDLFFALQKSIVDALRAVEAQYREEGYGADKKSLALIRKKIDLLCQEVEGNFLAFFGDSLKESDILFYGENQVDVSKSPLSRFFSDDELDSAGETFCRFFHTTFPSKLVQAFTEHLKTNKRAWIAYQRMLLQEMQQQLGKNLQLTEEVNAKIDDLAKAFSMAGVLYETNNQVLVEHFMQQNETMRDCWKNAQDDLEQLISQLGALNTEWISEWRRHMAEGRELQQKTLSGIDAIQHEIRSLKFQQKGAPDDIDEEDLEKRVLPVYLNWIHEVYFNIKLPEIQEQSELPSIPLEQVYVALRLFNKKSEQELLFSSELINSKVKERIKQEDREVSGDELDRFRSEILQENPTLHAVAQMQTAADGSGSQSMNLAEAFKNFRYLVILGDPGSGKSTLSKWLMLKLAGGLNAYQTTQLDETRIALNEVEIVQKPAESDSNEAVHIPSIDLGPARLPVLIKISDYFHFWENYSYNPAKPDAGRGIIDFIGTALHIPKLPDLRHKDAKKLIQHYLNRGRAVIILDGLDEIVSDRTSINNEINDFIKTWIDFGNKKNGVSAKSVPGTAGGNQIIVTSRIVGYHTTPLPNTFSKVFIEKMDNPALEHFCEVWTRQMVQQNERSAPGTAEEKEALIAGLTKELKAAIFDPARPQIRELATNPLLVTMLAILFRYGDGHLPSTRVELYEKSVNILIEKWQLDRRHNLRPEEVRALMQTLAAHIHSSPSEDVGEDMLKKIFEQEFCLQAGWNIENGVPDDIAEKAKWVLSMIRSDVGLLSDRGGKLYHFLHRTFQEYLAGLYLLRDEQKAPDEIIDRIADPIWREPIVLALGYANQFGRSDDFDQLLKRILKVEDEIKDLIPRTILLVAIALPEMSRLSFANFKDIIVEFLRAFGLQKKMSQSEAVQRQIRIVLSQLREGKRAEDFFLVCSELLREPEYGVAQWAVLNLAALEVWGQESWVYDLLEHLPQDSQEWNWPIDRVLQTLLGGADFKLRENDALKFRNKLLQNPDWENFVKASPAWMRLITVLYGGWPADSEKIVNKYAELEQLRYRFFEGAVDMENEGFSLAVRLDTEGGEVNSMNGGHFVFNIRSIHRESPFTRMLHKAISEETDASELIPAFLDIWQLETDPEIRALSLLALSALGYNTAMLVYQHENNAADRPAIDRFLGHLQRIQNGLQSSLIRFYLVLQRVPNVLAHYSFRNLHVMEKSMFNRILLDLFYRADLPPLQITDAIPGKKAWFLGDSEEDLRVKTAVEVFAWIARTGTFTFDPIGELNAMLQNHGQILAGPNGAWLFESLENLPFHKILSNQSKFALDWRLPKMPFPDSADKNRRLFVVEIINGLPEKLNFLKEWMLRQIWPMILEQPDTIPYACTVLLKLPNGLQALQELLPDVFDSEQPLRKIEDLIVQVQDPLCRFKAIDNVFLPDRTPALQKLYIASFLDIQNPQEWFLALDHLLSSHYLELHFPDGSVMQLPYIDLNAFLDVNAQKPLSAQIDEKLQQMDDDLDRAIFMLTFLKNLPEDELRTQVFRVMDAVVETENELFKVVMLRMILVRFGSVARKYPHWMKINASFTQQDLLNYALQKDYLSVFGFDRKLTPGTYQEEVEGGTETRAYPDARPLMSLVGVLRMAQQLSDRFNILDLIEFHANRLLDPDHREQALGFFLTHTQDGLTLNRHWVSIIDALVEAGADDTVQCLLPLFGLEQGSDIEIVAHWENHSVDWVLNFYHLLLAEAGVLNQQVLNSVLEYLGEYSDRMRYRAAIAIHGPNPSSHQENRRFFTSKIDYDDLVRQYSMVLETRLAPAFRTTLGWFGHNLVHNSTDIIQQLIDATDQKRAQDSRAEQLALRRLEFCTIDVLNFLGEKLAQSQGVSAEMIWKALSRMLFSNSGYPRRIKVIHNAIKKGLAAPSAVEALKGLIDYETTSESVAQVLLTEGKSEAVPEKIVENAKVALANATLIDPFSCKDKEEEAISELYRWGSMEYYSNSDEQVAAQNFSQAIAGKPAIIKALLEWTLEVLDDELTDFKKRSLGSALVCLLAQVSRDYPDTLESLYNRQKTVELLYECVTSHDHFSVRMSSAAILCRLRQVDPKTLKALVNALKDVQPVRDTVLTELKHLSRIFNQATFDALKQLIFSPNGTVAQAATQLLGAIARQSSFDIQLRKQTISVLARALRNQLVHPAGKCLIYYTPMISIIPKPVFKSHLETTLYNELIALSGVNNDQSIKTNA